jgi:hypothetical protein
MIKRALTQAGAAFNDVSQIVDMTTRFFFGITVTPDQAPQFSAVGLGNYPSFLLGWRLTSSGWKSKSSSAGSWFESAKGGLQVATVADTVFLISGNRIESLLPLLKGSPAYPMPSDAVQDFDKADLVVYMPELPGGIMEKAAGTINIPIREVWLDARQRGSGFDVGGTLNCSTDKEARLLSVMLKLGLVVWMRSQNMTDVGERLQSVTIEPVGNQVLLTGLSVTEDELIPLLLSFITKGIPLSENAS